MITILAVATDTMSRASGSSGDPLRNTSLHPARCDSGSAPSKMLSISNFSRPWLSTTTDSRPSFIQEYCWEAQISLTIRIVWARSRLDVPHERRTT